ncbi:NAD(P)-binding protein [Artomyces pyxidatus]|uniref:NAD(P)-binding protein n=1 Tax=Artomyces pyxidatus TaxID=48021 RepID=A0ACB8TAU9_9AGAM|nr:NAD(P)-binding protein [Artomyces pyxidatus]
MSLLVLASSDVDRVAASFTPEALQDLMAQVFYSSSASSKILSPPRSTIAMSNHTTLFMPARIDGIGTSVKVVSVPRAAHDDRGLPASTLVLDETTGAAKAIVNARALTALRTAAGSVLATALLHPPPTARPARLVAFGAGRQVQAHVDLLLAAYPSLTHVTVVNRAQNARLRALLAYLQTRHPTTRFTAAATPDVQEAVAAADFICTATSATSPLFPAAWVRPGAHLILVGSYTPAMHEVDAALVRRAGVVVVDSREACGAEAGELIAAGIGRDRMVELGELVDYRDPRTGEAGRWEPDARKCQSVRDAGDVTIFKSVGIGAQDVAIASAVVNKALGLGAGTMVKGYDA